ATVRPDTARARPASADTWSAHRRGARRLGLRRGRDREAARRGRGRVARGMATLVTFHAHPDDESIATGGTMAKAAAAGHRVVLVLATKGEHGEVAEGFLEPDEEVWERRMAETMRSAELPGVGRCEF